MEHMISYFDMYCIERAFMNPSADNYKYLDVARLEFYLEHGIDEKYKKVITDLITAQSKDYETIIGLADKLTPPVTKILNIELETKRKFYTTLDNTTELLSVKTAGVPTYANKLFRILDNKKLFHDFLTRNTDDLSGVIRFIDYKAKNRLGNPWKLKKDFPTSDLWKRLQKVSLNWVADDVKLIREYQKNLSADLLKKRIVNSVSTYSLYLNNDVAADVYTDTLDFIATLNENDLQRANDYKLKKKLLLENQLKEIETLPVKVNEFNLLNKVTGEVVTSNDDINHFADDNYSIKSDDENNQSFVIHGPEDILKSVLHDLHLKREEYTKILAKNDLHYNERIVIQSKLDKIMEKIKCYNDGV